MLTPNLSFTLSGAVLPKIAYVDLAGSAQTLSFRYPPQQVAPAAPVPARNDNVAADGTMWSITLYVEAYLQMTVLILLGDDLTNWLNFVQAAVNGQVMKFYPDGGSYYSYVRLMVQGTSSGSNSNVPTGDPTPKPVAPGRFKSQLVFRYETPSDAPTVFQKLNNWS